MGRGKREPPDRGKKRSWFELWGTAETPPRVTAKRPAPGPQPSKEECRAEIAGIYAAYDALFRGCREGQGREEDYLALLKAAEGSIAAKRLAARLLPRFVQHFPRHARATADVLAELSRLSLSDAPAVAPSAAAETRTDALAGLPAVVAAARVETDHQAVIPLVNYAFKQLQSLPAACLPLPPPLLPNGASNGQQQQQQQQQAQQLSPLFSKATEPLWALLEAAFTHFPRVVLAACIHALKKPGDNPQLFAVASQFVSYRLLAPRSRPAGADADADPPAIAAEQQQQQQQQDGEDDTSPSGAKAVAAAPADAGDGKQQQQQRRRPPPGPSLFKEVMMTEEREQRWFRQHVQQFLQELPPSAGADACVVLQQLVKELPSSPQHSRPQQPSPIGKHARRESSDEQAKDETGWQHLGNGPQAEHQQQHRLSPAKRRTFSAAPPAADVQSRLPPHLQPRAAGAPNGLGAQGTASLPAHPPGFGGPSQQGLPGSPAAPHSASRFGRSFDEGPPSTSYGTGAEGRLDRRFAAAAAGPGDGSRGVPMDIDTSPGVDGKPPGSGIGAPPPYPTPGDNICLATACLWLHGLPGYLDEGDVSRECGRHGRVAGAVLPPPKPGEVAVAYVNFPSVRDAMRVYEAMCEAAPWRGCRPLDIRFCGSEAYAPTAPAPPPQHPCTHVWVAGVANIGDEGEVMRCCKDAGVPAPEHLLRVGGRRPGLLMSFAAETTAAAAVQVLRGANLRLSGLAPGPPGGTVLDLNPGGPGSGAPPLAEPNGPALAESHSFGLGRVLSNEGPSALQGLGPGGAAAVAGGGGPLQEYAPRLPPPEYWSKTLWVGQIPPTMRDEEVLRIFAQCGEVVGHKFMRHTNCAFVDFATQGGATEARKKLDGARVGGAVFRVEYKNEKQWWAMQAQQRGPAGGSGPPGGPARLDSGGLRDRDVYHPPFRDQPPPGHHLQQQQQQLQQPGLASRFSESSPGGLPPPPYSRSNSGLPGPGGGSMPLPGAPPPGWPPRGPPATPGPGGAPPGGQQDPGSQQREIRRLESAVSLGALHSGSLPPPAFGSGGSTASGALSGPPPPQQHPQQQQLQQQQQQPAWHGKLAKSKVPVCGVVCIDPPAAPAAPGAWAAAEPQHWPPVLDVGMRADLQYVCGAVYGGVAPGERAVRRIVPLADPAHQRSFSEFVQYLAGKSRAGVVKLPPAPPAAGARHMYLIPPSDQTRAALGLPHGEQPADYMLALIVPAAAK